MSDDLDGLTKDELQDRARERDLSVSGTKDEILARLRDAEDTEHQTSSDQQPREGDQLKLSARGAIEALRDSFSDVTGMKVEAVTGLSPDESGWKARLQVLEMQRIPPSSDVVAVYDVAIDGSGELVSFDQAARGRRDSLSST